MPDNRFYFEGSLKGSSAELQGTEFHHLVNVMRAKVGDEIELVNGEGYLAYATIRELAKKKASLEIQKLIYESPPKFQLILAQALPRMNRLDFILEKGTELGMTDLLLFPGETSERKKLTEDQINRMQSVTISAMKQCGRLYLPKIEFKPPLNKWTKSNLESYYGDVSQEAPKFADCRLSSNGIIFFIGPETGLTDSEISILQNLGSKGVKLHQNILRTDTAGIVALAIASQIYIHKTF